MSGSKAQRYIIYTVNTDPTTIDEFVVTDAFDRDNFYKSSVQVVGRDFVVQGSNVNVPEESTEEDWVDIASSVGSYANFEHLCKWFRLKGNLEAGDKVYIVSLANTIS